jgi:hypothetical protein
LPQKALASLIQAKISENLRSLFAMFARAGPAHFCAPEPSSQATQRTVNFVGSFEFLLKILAG